MFIGSSVFARNEVYKVADKRRTEVSDYCNRLMTLQPKISQFPKLLEFLGVRTDDLNVSNKNKWDINIQLFAEFHSL